MMLAFILIAALLYQQPVCSWAQTLSQRATDPITDLSQLQMENDFSPKNEGAHGTSNKLLIKPLIAFQKTTRLPLEQLMRFKFQVPSMPHSSATRRETALGDTQFFHLFVSEEPWGRWGAGPMAIFPTASKLDAGQGKWQLGPAIGVSVLKFTNWQFGFLAQNPVSFAGNSHKSKQNYLLLQPFINYHFSRKSYFISNAEWTINWRNDERQIPLNIGIGHTFSLFDSLKIDSALQFQWIAYQNATKTVGFIPKYTVQLSLNLLFN